MTRFADAILKVAPPWLARGDGGKFLAAIGEVVDDLDLRLSDGVKLRFPGLVTDDSLSMIGRERRIIRGPSEPAATYARRLRRWWTDHSTRGGPYAMLSQLHAYFRDSEDPRIDVVSAHGLRHWVASGVEDIDAPGSITRDQITWDPIPDEYGEQVELAANATAGDSSVRPISLDGFFSSLPLRVRISDGAGGSELATVVGTASGPDRLLLAAPLGASYSAGPASVARLHVEWAHVWVFLHLDGPPATATALVSQAGITISTQSGDDLLVITDLSGGDPLAAEEAEVYLVVPRAWSAAHIPYVTVVLLWGNGRLWGYPQPVPTWGSWTWGEDPPVILIAE